MSILRWHPCECGCLAQHTEVFGYTYTITYMHDKWCVLEDDTLKKFPSKQEAEKYILSVIKKMGLPRKEDIKLWIDTVSNTVSKK